jgi:15-cis-phytoene desaturase
MEGATLAGKLAAEVVAAKAKGLPTKGIKAVQQDVVAKALQHTVKPPPGVKGFGAVAFGGGAVLSKNDEDVLRLTDPAQLVALG